MLSFCHGNLAGFAAWADRARPGGAGTLPAQEPYGRVDWGQLDS